MTQTRAPVGRKWSIEEGLRIAALSYVDALEADPFSTRVQTEACNLIAAADTYRRLMREYDALTAV